MAHRVVQVIWWDAQDHPDKWADAQDVKAWADTECEISSVGYLVSDTAKYVTLAGDLDPADGDYGRVTKIPKNMVRRIEDLHEKDAVKSADS
jgi:hypothetical protein